MATALDRFTCKYVVADNGCWLWTGATVGLSFNYGKFWIDGGYDKAHRAAYRLFVGPIPTGMWVLHHCDTPECVNPKHLFIGTRQDNVDDMLAKKRGGQWKNPPRGNRRRDSKFTEADVLDIRRRCDNGESQGSVAKSFGVGQSTISKIIRRQRWAHV